MDAGYCLKCRGVTSTDNAQRVEAKGRTRLVGTCAKCGSKKSVFVKGDAKAAAPAKPVKAK
jgi:RNase P subunit RPR2